MKVLVLGSNGMLGHMVTKYLKYKKIDVSLFVGRWPKDKEFLSTWKGDYIINCIGAIPQRTKDFSVNWELPITHKDMTRFLLTLDQAVDLIEWSYTNQHSHGKIVIPRIKALKIVDIAKSLGRAYGHKDIKLSYVGIRPGEKLHEAMISETESFRTEWYENYYMISDQVINSLCWTYSSDTSLMKSEETDSFLKETKVI